MGLGDGEVAVSDGFVKGEGLLFHAVALVVGFGAGSQAGKALRAVHVKKEGDVGEPRTGGKTVDALDGGAGDPAGDALVDGGGIEETIRDDDVPGGEGGEDFFADQLGAAGGKEEEFGFGRHGAIIGRVLEEVADVFADGGAAGLADEEGFMPGGVERFNEVADLRALAATFRTFETDEETCLTRVGHTGIIILMSQALVQSRKISFVEVEEEARAFFHEALAAHEVVFVRKLEEVPQDAEVVSVFISEKIGEDFLAAHPALRLIASRSTGWDHIDLAACRRRNIAVSNVGNYGENTVAEHTFALILALSRRLRDSDEAVRTGHFSRERLRGFDLRGKTLGVVGAGRVGLHVIRIALGFGMRVIACDADPHPFYSELLDFRYVSLEELLRESHVITLHVPLNNATRHMINRDSLALCQPGILLINTARGGLIETEAVIEALDAGQVAGLGVDVLEDERVFQGGGAASILGEQIAERVHNASAVPVNREFSSGRVAEFSRLVTHNRLMQRRDVVLTPHVAFNSQEAARCLSDLTLESILDYLDGKQLKHRCV